jgi:hypothetical protein
VVEEQHRSPRQRTDDTHDPRLDIFVRVHDVIHDQRHGRAERRNDGGVDGRGVGGSPEQHVHPTVDNQHGDDQYVARVAPPDAERLLRKKGERDEENRARKHLQHEYLLEIEIIARERDIE